MYAFALEREVGVDIEQIRADIASESIAENFFSPSEVQTLRALPREHQSQGFFNCWTRKEAYIKARGQGLSIELNSFDVSLSRVKRQRFCAVTNPAAGLCARSSPRPAGWRHSRCTVPRFKSRDLAGFEGVPAAISTPLNFSALRSPANRAKISLDDCLEITRPDPCAISSIQIQCDCCELLGRYRITDRRSICSICTRNGR